MYIGQFGGLGRGCVSQAGLMSLIRKEEKFEGDDWKLRGRKLKLEGKKLKLQRIS